MVGCLGDASKQSVERLDAVMIDSTAMATAHLPAAVAVVGRARFTVERRLPAASAGEPRITAQHGGEHVVQIDVSDDEQRPIPRRPA